MAGQGKGPVRIAIEDFFETYVSEGIGGYIQRKADEQADKLLESYDLFLTQLKIREEVPEILRPGSPIPAVLGAIAAFPVIGGFFVMVGMAIASAVVAPISGLVGLAVRRHFKDWRGDPAMLLAMQNRFPELSERWEDDWDELGIPTKMLEAVQTVLLPTVPEGDLLTLWYRDENARNEIETELKARGWTEARITNLIKVREIIPGVGDLIRFAVREAFRPDIIEKFGYDQDIPTEIIPWFEKQGLSEEWFNRYWYSHWELPSVQAGYAMMHRLRPETSDNPFVEEDLEDLMRAADIPEFFRSRLKEISFSVFTRVDVRRMFRVGVLDAEGVKSAYMDLGYNETRAEKMTEFTIKLETQKQRDLTRSNIEAGYKRQVIVRDAAKTALIDIGYVEADAEYFLAIIDFDAAKADIDEAIDEAKFLYLEGEIDDTGVYTLLNPLNLPAEQIAKLIVQFELLRRRKRVLPSKGDLEDFYRRDLITVEMLQEGLSKRRFDAESIELYLLRLDQKVAEDASREAERAQREQERIEAAEFKNEYQRRKAELDVMIAQAKLAMADLKLSKHFVEDPARLDQIKLELDELKVIIAELQVAKAEVKFEEVG